MTPKTLLRRLTDESRSNQSAGRARGRGEHGDTLIELLMALGVLGIVVVALLMGFWTSITSSVTYRTTATMDTVVRTATEKATSLWQQNASNAFTCPHTSAVWSQENAPYLPGPSDFGLPPGYNAQIDAVSYWKAGTETANCIVGSPQLLTIEVSSTSSTSATERVDVVVDNPIAPTVATIGPPAKLVFQTDGGSTTGTSGSPLNPQPVVAVEDAGSNIVTSDLSDVSLAITAGTPGGTLVNCSGTPFLGVITFRNCEIDQAGQYTVTATHGALSTKSPPITVVPGPPTQLVVTGPAGQITAGAPFPTQPTVAVEDAFNNIVASDTSQVTLAIGSTTPAGGTLTCGAGQNSVLAVAGQAIFAGCQIDKAANSYILTASDGALAQATSSSFNVNPGAASKLLFTTGPSPTATNSVAFTSQPVVTIQDGLGNTVTNSSAPVTLILNPVTGKGSLKCSTNPVAPRSGAATFSGCKVTLGTNGAGTFTLTATASNLPTVTTSSFTVH